MDYKLLSNPYGSTVAPVWDLPDNAVYVAPPYVGTYTTNTWTKHTKETTETVGTVEANLNKTGYYWIKV